MPVDLNSPGTAVVTGAARGIGAGIARAAASAGMTVVLADRDGAAVTRVAAELGGIGVETDVTEYDALARLADIAFAQRAPVQLVANNAGIERVGLLWEASPASWHDVIDVNLNGVYHGVRAFVPRLLEQGTPASLLHTSSIAAFTTGAQQGAYQTSKRAVLALSECLVSELAAVDAPISVTVAFPGPVDTEIFDLPAPDSSESAAALTMLQRLVHKRGMAPDDAGRLLFDTAVAGRPWVTTDVDALRTFLGPQRAAFDEIASL